MSVLIATEREIRCRTLKTAVPEEALFIAPQNHAIVDFVCIPNDPDEAVCIVLMVSLTLPSKFFMQSIAHSDWLTPVLQQPYNLDTPNGLLLTLASSGDQILLAMVIENEIHVHDTYTMKEVPDTLTWMNVDLMLSPNLTPTIILCHNSEQAMIENAVIDLRIRSAAQLCMVNEQPHGIVIVGILDGLLIADLHGNTAMLSVPTNPVCKPSVEWLS